MIYWVRNKKGQIAAEISETALSVHDQTLSWKLLGLKEEGASPFSAADAHEGRRWNIGSLLSFLEENGYVLERQDR